MKDLCKECSVYFSTLNRLQTFWVFWKLPSLYFHVLCTLPLGFWTHGVCPWSITTTSHLCLPCVWGTWLRSFLKTNTPLTSLQYPWYWVSLCKYSRKWTGHVKEECLSFSKHTKRLKTIQWRTNENHLCPDFLHSHFVLKTQDFSSILTVWGRVRYVLKKPASWVLGP